MALTLGSSASVSAQAGTLDSDKRIYGQSNTTQESLSDQVKSDAPTLWGVLSRTIVFLVVLAGIAGAVMHYARKGKFNLNGLKPIGTENKLIILETRMLGSRQHLTVVEYNEQKMLLGVSPGKIEHLCFLESVYEEEIDSGEFEEA